LNDFPVSPYHSSNSGILDLVNLLSFDLGQSSNVIARHEQCRTIDWLYAAVLFMVLSIGPVPELGCKRQSSVTVMGGM
jgi:hypothetical protein